MTKVAYKKKTIKERFESKFRINPETGCWVWTASTKDDGYGQFKFNGKSIRAHRFSYELYIGKILKGLCALHKCVGNRRCVNPGHLYLGTQEDNMKDMVSQNRGYRGGPKVPAKGSDVGSSKLNELQVEEARELYISGTYTLRYLGKKFGVSHAQISRVISSKSWGHL